MLDALSEALRSAATTLAARGVHGRLSVRRVQNDGRTVGVVSVRMAPEATAQDERTAIAEVYAACEAAAVPVNVLAA